MSVIVYSIMQMTICLGIAAVGILAGKWWLEEHGRKSREDGGNANV